MTSKKPQSEAEIEPSGISEEGTPDLRYKGYLKLGDAITRNNESMKTSDRPIKGPEAEQAVQITPDKPVTQADRVEAAQGARQTIAGALQVEPETAPPSATPSRLDIPRDLLQQVSVLLNLDSLESHREALQLMKEHGIVASARWNAIHSDPNAAHNFSKVSKKRVNTFAKNILRPHIMGLGPDAVIMDIGCGFGNDAKWMARHSGATIMGVDISTTAITAGRNNIRQCGLEERVILEEGDFFPDLEAWAAMEKNLDIVYSHSTLHYSPPQVLKHVTFPLIARALSGQMGEETKPGRLCLAMKLAESASAQSPNQIRLVDGDPYYPSYDSRDKIFRIYPRSKRHVIALLKPSFDIEYARVVPVKDYDRKGDTEVFAYIIGRPRRNPA